MGNSESSPSSRTKPVPKSRIGVANTIETRTGPVILRSSDVSRSNNGNHQEKLSKTVIAPKTLADPLQVTIQPHFPPATSSQLINLKSSAETTLRKHSPLPTTVQSVRPPQRENYLPASSSRGEKLSKTIIAPKTLEDPLQVTTQPHFPPATSSQLNNLKSSAETSLFHTEDRKTPPTTHFSLPQKENDQQASSSKEASNASTEKTSIQVNVNLPATTSTTNDTVQSDNIYPQYKSDYYRKEYLKEPNPRNDPYQARDPYFPREHYDSRNHYGYSHNFRDYHDNNADPYFSRDHYGSTDFSYPHDSYQTRNQHYPSQNHYPPAPPRDYSYSNRNPQDFHYSRDHYSSVDTSNRQPYPPDSRGYNSGQNYVGNSYYHEGYAHNSEITTPSQAYSHPQTRFKRRKKKFNKRYNYRQQYQDNKSVTGDESDSSKDSCEVIEKTDDEPDESGSDSEKFSTENIISEEIAIDPKYCYSLMGIKRTQINSIMGEYDVAIEFPNSDSKTDKIYIRGPEKNVNRAKQEIIDLVFDILLANHADEIITKAENFKFIIGKNGANIRKLRYCTGAKIFISSAKAKDREKITIFGDKEAVNTAKRLIENMIVDIENMIEDELIVDRKHYHHFLSAHGKVVKKIRKESDVVEITFPKLEDDGNVVFLKGSKEKVEDAKQRIRRIVEDLESTFTVKCTIEKECHGKILEGKGYRVKNIESKYDVNVMFPNKDQTEDDQKCNVVQITGKKEINCLQAKRALLALVPVIEEVRVPLEFHASIIGSKGSAVKDLRKKFNVYIDLPSIGAENDFVKITGKPEDVENAKKALMERVQELEAIKLEKALKSFTLKFEVLPFYHSKIIGKGGAVINKIKQDHNVQIMVPKKGGVEQNIIIKGYEADAYKAKEDILKVILS